MIGVIIANTGSPSSPDPDAIEEYLREYLMDDRIRQMPRLLWKRLVYKHILPKRKHSSSQRYQFVWTEHGSPLVVNQDILAGKANRLYAGNANENDEDVLVRSAMSYGEPSIAHVLQKMREEGAERIVLLPLYPQSAYSPTLAVIDAFWRAQDAIDWHPRSTVIDNYHDDPGYISAIARSIQQAGYDPQAGDRLMLSLHAIPLKDERSGDTYRGQIAESTRLIARELDVDPADITVSFQSVFGHDKSKWTSPLSTDILSGWSDETFRVVYACPGFAIDCLETLYDIPHDMVPALEGEAAKPTANHVNGDIQAACNTKGRFVWVPTLNTSDEHAALVKAIIDKHISEKP